MKSFIFLLFTILIIVNSHEFSGEGYPNITKCVEVCEQEAQKICQDEEICADSVEQVNECIQADCESLEDEQAQEQCADKCIEKHGHEGVQYYNQCIDVCIENADEKEKEALEKDLIGKDPDYQSLLEEWTKIIEDGELDEGYLKNLLNEYEDGLLKDILPTNKDQLEQLKNLEKLEQQNQEQEQQEEEVQKIEL